jgi:6-phospho-beta-glucosidase
MLTVGVYSGPEFFWMGKDDVIGYLTWGSTDILSSQGQMEKGYEFIYVNRVESEIRDLKRYKKKSFDWFKRVIETNAADLEKEIPAMTNK